MGNSVELHRIGSDPEFSFATPDSKRHITTVLPAPILVGDDRDLRLRSFIGTDGHANTAELRPNPCNNVYWHLIKIADGLNEVRQSMTYHSKRLGTPIVAVAQPSLGGTNETMGGHIWISLWFKSKLSSDIVHKMGRIYDNDLRDYLYSRQQRPDISVHKVTSARLQLYHTRAAEGTEISRDLLWKKLHYLLGLVEHMVFGKTRGDRAVAVRDHYVRFADAVTEQDQAMFKPGWAYLRYEYRYPSTWLAHPTLAFVYLGLAKLAILNWDILPTLSELNATQSKDKMIYTDLVTTKDFLRARIHTLINHKEFKITRDLSGLMDALNSLYSVQLKFPALIHFDAWAALKPPTTTFNSKE